MTKKYKVLYVDPPWFYNSKKTGGERNNKTKFGGGAMKHYPLMKDKDLLEMKNSVDSISDENSIMFMWVTMPRLDFGIQLLQHWGFKYKTVAFTWVKLNKDGSYRINPGYYTASNIEMCIIGIKGKKGGEFKPSQSMINQIIAEPLRKHSQKPDIIRDKINLMYPNYEKVELFARNSTPGWDIWGNEVKSDIEFE